MIRTGEQYLAGLRDGRTVYYDGERVEDVTKHPLLGLVAAEVAGIRTPTGDEIGDERSAAAVDA